MDRTRRSIFGHGDLDRYSLAEVAVLKVSAGVECRKCRKFAAVDVDELTRLHGCQFTLGEVRHLARCRRCGSNLPFVLIRSQAIRGDRAWYPRPPGSVGVAVGSAVAADTRFDDVREKALAALIHERSDFGIGLAGA